MIICDLMVKNVQSWRVNAPLKKCETPIVFWRIKQLICCIIRNQQWKGMPIYTPCTLERMIRSTLRSDCWKIFWPCNENENMTNDVPYLTWGHIEVGIPQGSCIGPLLFLICINDLPQAVWGSTVSMYVDDTTLCHKSHDMTQLNKAINNDLKNLDNWLQGNKLSLNVQKQNLCLQTLC